MERICWKEGLQVEVLTVDPRVHADWDLTVESVVNVLSSLVKSKLLLGIHAAPPCSTISAARHRPLGGRRGPRPLRLRLVPFDPIAGLSERELVSCMLGSHLFAVPLHLMYLLHRAGG